MSEGREEIAITPDTRIGALLARYPELESVLIDLAPAFAKLRNPALRQTVARVTTLRQAAKVGGVPLAELINALRSAAGIAEKKLPEESSPPDHSPPPDWMNPEHIIRSLDARPMIEAGEQPMKVVLRELQDVPPERVYELITPFVPAPLIDTIRRQGFTAWWQQTDLEVVKTYFYRPATG